MCKTVSKNPVPVVPAQDHCRYVQEPTVVLYHAHMSPHYYASTVSDGCSDLLCKALNGLHRRAAKLILTDPSLTLETKLQHLGLLSIGDKLRFDKTVLVFKACRSLGPPYVKTVFICSNTRASSRTITVPKPRINIF